MMQEEAELVIREIAQSRILSVTFDPQDEWTCQRSYDLSVDRVRNRRAKHAFGKEKHDSGDLLQWLAVAQPAKKSIPENRIQGSMIEEIGDIQQGA